MFIILNEQICVKVKNLLLKFLRHELLMRRDFFATDVFLTFVLPMFVIQFLTLTDYVDTSFHPFHFIIVVYTTIALFLYMLALMSSFISFCTYVVFYRLMSFSIFSKSVVFTDVFYIDDSLYKLKKQTIKRKNKFEKNNKIVLMSDANMEACITFS